MKFWGGGNSSWRGEIPVRAPPLYATLQTVSKEVQITKNTCRTYWTVLDSSAWSAVEQLRESTGWSRIRLFLSLLHIATEPLAQNGGITAWKKTWWNRILGSSSILMLHPSTVIPQSPRVTWLCAHWATTLAAFFSSSTDTDSENRLQLPVFFVFFQWKIIYVFGEEAPGSPNLHLEVHSQNQRWLPVIAIPGELVEKQE